MTAMDPLFEAVDFRSLLLEHYKTMGFHENHVMVLLMMDQLLRQDNAFITPELLSLKMSLALKEIDVIIVQLLDKHMIEYVLENNKTITSIRPIKHLLHKQFQQHVIRQTQELNLDQGKNIFQAIETSFLRSLSPLEISRIRDWLNYGYSEAMILDVLKEAVLSHKKSIRYMDKLLQKMTIKDNIQREGTPGSTREHRPIQEEMDQFTHDGLTNKK
jgi:DNA replication protein DnaD